MNPLIITVAGVGGELTKKQTPYLPATPLEIIQEARIIAKHGAHIFHLHVRDEKGDPTLDNRLLKKVVGAIKRETGLIVQISTGGAIHDLFEARVGTLNCGAEMGSLTLGSVNFGAEVFLNPRPLIERLAKKMLHKRIKPELEIFDVGMVEEAHRLIEKKLLVPPCHFNIVLGGPGWLPATVENLKFILKKLPHKSSWSASGIGKNQLPMIEYAVSHGGHVRTGLEDNIYVRKGVLAKGNAELVEQVLILAMRYRRPIASVRQARRLLGLR